MQTTKTNRTVAPTIFQWHSQVLAFILLFMPIFEWRVIRHTAAWRKTESAASVHACSWESGTAHKRQKFYTPIHTFIRQIERSLLHNVAWIAFGKVNRQIPAPMVCHAVVVRYLDVVVVGAFYWKLVQEELSQTTPVVFRRDSKTHGISGSCLAVITTNTKTWNQTDSSCSLKVIQQT